MSSNTNRRNNKNHNNKLQKKEQIPTEYNEEQTQRAIRKQGEVSGQGREKTVYHFPYTAAIGQILKNLEFPTNKHSIIEYVQQKQSTIPQGKEILSVLRQIDERSYENVADIVKAAGLVVERS